MTQKKAAHRTVGSTFAFVAASRKTAEAAFPNGVRRAGRNKKKRDDLFQIVALFICTFSKSRRSRPFAIASICREINHAIKQQVSASFNI